MLSLLCCFGWITSCTPEEYEVDLSYGLTHAIAMYDGNENTGTFQFYKLLNRSMIDKGVSYDRTMDAILEATVPGSDGGEKYTVFVLQNDDVKDMSLTYFGKSAIELGTTTVATRNKAFKLLQFYYVVGEYRVENLPSKLKMDNGYEISISGNKLTGFSGTQVQIVSGNNEARNGVFHVIDGPLHPVTTSSFVDYNTSYFYSYATYEDKKEYNPY